MPARVVSATWRRTQPRTPHRSVDLVFTNESWEDCQHWLATDRTILRRLNAIIKDTSRSPFEGIGKPEPLKGDLSGWWARRITHEHRFVYRVVGVEGSKALEIAACRFHY